MAEMVRSRAISTLTRGMIAQATRDIGAEYNLSASRIRQGLIVERSRDYVELTGSGAGIGIAQGYGGKQTKQGVLVTLRRSSAPTLFRHAFIKHPGGRTKATGPQAFERSGGRGSPRYPLDRIFSQTIAGMLRDPARVRRIADFAQRVLAAEIQRQLKIL